MSKSTFTLLLEALEQEYGRVTQSDLANALGVTQPTISNWKSGSTPSTSNLRKILDYYREHHASTLVKAIFEFEEVQPVTTGKSWSFLPEKEDVNWYREKLRKRRGIYIYYDSAGHAIYLGKSEVCIFTESKQRLGAVPNRQFYGPGRVGHGCIAKYTLYMSAYEVGITSAIRNIEAFMLRSFANDLWNKNIGNFQSLFGR